MHVDIVLTRLYCLYHLKKKEKLFLNIAGAGLFREVECLQLQTSLL